MTGIAKGPRGKGDLLAREKIFSQVNLVLAIVPEDMVRLRFLREVSTHARLVVFAVPGKCGERAAEPRARISPGFGGNANFRKLHVKVRRIRAIMQRKNILLPNYEFKAREGASERARACVCVGASFSSRRS